MNVADRRWVRLTGSQILEVAMLLMSACNPSAQLQIRNGRVVPHSQATFECQMLHTATGAYSTDCDKSAHELISMHVSIHATTSRSNMLYNAKRNWAYLSPLPVVCVTLL